MTDEAEREFDIAVSFAGENRAYVEEVVRGLNADEVNVFYDDDFRVETWGEDLVEFFTDLYQNRARYVVMFISAPYESKMWTRLERRSALANAATQRSAYILPIRLDDTELPGLLPTVSFLDARREGLQGIIDAIHAKVGSTRVVAPTTYDGRVPRSPEEIEQLVALRPDFWEYWLYAGVLFVRMQALEDKFRDNEIGYAPGGERYSGREAWDFLRAIPDSSLNLAAAFNAVLGADVQTRAFGEPGVAGDPERITHMANRLMDIYEQFMDQAARVRGAALPSDFHRARDAAAKFGDASIVNIRQFVLDAVEQFDAFPESTANGEDVHLTMEVKLEIPDGLSAEFTAGMEEAAESLMDD